MLLIIDEIIIFYRIRRRQVNRSKSFIHIHKMINRSLCAWEIQIEVHYISIKSLHIVIHGSNTTTTYPIYLCPPPGISFLGYEKNFMQVSLKISWLTDLLISYNVLLEIAILLFNGLH